MDSSLKGRQKLLAYTGRKHTKLETLWETFTPRCSGSVAPGDGNLTSAQPISI